MADSDWQAGEIVLSTKLGPFPISAEIKGQLAVHSMIDADEAGKLIIAEGFTISHAAKGLRISCDYRVFRTAEAAKRVADRINGLKGNWDDFFIGQHSEAFLAGFVPPFVEAERAGDCLAYFIAPASPGECR